MKNSPGKGFNMEDAFQLGIKALIQNQNGEVLVLKANTKTYATPVPDHRDLPGGRIHKGSTIKQTLHQESEEEIGIKTVKIIKLLDASISNMRISYVDIGLILFTYLCTIPKNSKIKIIDEEHTEFAWVSPKKAAQLLSIKFPKEFTHKVRSLNVN